MGTLISSTIQDRQFRGLQSSQENEIDYVLHKTLAECTRQLRYNYALPMKCPKKNIFISTMPLKVN